MSTAKCAHSSMTPRKIRSAPEPVSTRAIMPETNTALGSGPDWIRLRSCSTGTKRVRLSPSRSWMYVSSSRRKVTRSMPVPA